jgi:hypothetical protein
VSKLKILLNTADMNFTIIHKANLENDIKNNPFQFIKRFCVHNRDYDFSSGYDPFIFLVQISVII